MDLVDAIFSVIESELQLGPDEATDMWVRHTLNSQALVLVLQNHRKENQNAETTGKN